MNRVYSLCMECNAATGYPCYNGDNERMSGVHDSRAMIHGDDVDTLTAENAALREALRACITDEGAHCYQTGSVHAFDCRIKGINTEARAALALADGAK